MGSLQEALKKAGVKAKEPVKKKKEIIHRGRKKHTHHFKHRTTCDFCRKTTADVENYAHNNPRLKAKWLCLPCADQQQISDMFRETNQSEFALKGYFRRQYGRTKRFPRKN